jgi:hypothetical protein
VTVPPNAPGFGALCGATTGATIEIDGITDETFISEGILVQVDVTGPTGVERLLARAMMETLPQQILIGTAADGNCLGKGSLAHAELGKSYSAVVTVFDFAGNSASAEIPSFEFQQTTPGGCGGVVVDASPPSTQEASAGSESASCSIGAARKGGAGRGAIGLALALAALAYFRNRGRVDSGRFGSLMQRA